MKLKKKKLECKIKFRKFEEGLQTVFVCKVAKILMLMSFVIFLLSNLIKILFGISHNKLLSKSHVKRINYQPK